MSETAELSSDNQSFDSVLERELSILLRRARARSRLLAAASGVDIEADAYVLLVHIQSVENTRVTDVARYLGIGKPTVSRQLKILEEQGLIVRSLDPDDSRSSRLALTEKGDALLNHVRESRRKVMERTFGEWTEEERTTFARLLTKLNTSEHVDLDELNDRVEKLTSKDRDPNS